MAVDMDSLNFAWKVVTDELKPSSCVNNQSLSDAISVLDNYGMAEVICEWFLESLRQDLTVNISPHLWQNLNIGDNVDTQLFDLFVDAIDSLHKQLSAYPTLVDRLSLIELHGRNKTWLKEQVYLQIKAILFHRAPKHFTDVLYGFYTVAFRVYYTINKDPDNEDEDDELPNCVGCCQRQENCCCREMLYKFNKVNKQLKELDLLDRLSSEAVTRIIHQRIDLHIHHTCDGHYETSYTHILQKWLEETVIKWLLMVYTCDGEADVSSQSSSCVDLYKDRLQYYLNETYANIRINELFTIIIEYPESEPALLDLKACLEKTDLRAHAIKTLKSALETRLLHPGVNTADILTAYISAIKALRVLDSAGVILELVCEPVRKYLRSREDTVRCIVSSLTDGDSSELAGELIRGQKLIIDDNCQSDEEDENWADWMPDPVDADPSKTSKSRRSSDIISMLVNIYGSKELFVKEYRNLLADRILTQFSYEYEREIRYLELLKLRFGESELHDCEVMLKDVADSKRINARITEEKKQEEATAGNTEATPADQEEISVNALILSAQFWPQFREEKITLPDILQQSLETYTKSFETLKGNRTLNWKSHLGLMDIEVELKGRTLNLSVSPVQAAIIMQFQDKAKWSIDELSTVLQMPVSAVRRKITYWQSMGLLKEESTDVFLLVEEQKHKAQEVMVVDEEEAESAMASSHDQREEELQVFWQYIVGMLTNLESLPLERIHAILKMFASQGPSTQECSMEELKSFLDGKVKDQILTYSGGVYRLPK